MALVPAAAGGFSTVMALELTVSNDQRIAIIGQTRMGKTYLTGRLIDDQPRVIVIDSKHMVKLRGYHLTDSPTAALLTDRVIYRPESGSPPEDFWMAAVRSLHERGGGVIVIDEGSYITGANRIPKGLSDAIRLGGELGVGVWILAQEAVTVHNTTLRQSDMIIMFYNQGESDREKLATITGDMAFVTAHLPPHEFVVYVRGETYDHDAVPVYKVND